jgi:hypothetical protein
MHVASDEEVKKTVEDWFYGLATDLYNARTWYDKCMNLRGNYVEKLFKSVVMIYNNFFNFFYHQMVFTFWMILVF